jgi:hypothetical protein
VAEQILNHWGDQGWDNHINNVSTFHKGLAFAPYPLPTPRVLTTLLLYSLYTTKGQASAMPSPPRPSEHLTGLATWRVPECRHVLLAGLSWHSRLPVRVPSLTRSEFIEQKVFRENVLLVPGQAFTPNSVALQPGPRHLLPPRPAGRSLAALLFIYFFAWTC